MDEERGGGGGGGGGATSREKRRGRNELRHRNREQEQRVRGENEGPRLGQEAEGAACCVTHRVVTRGVEKTPPSPIASTSRNTNVNANGETRGWMV